MLFLLVLLSVLLTVRGHNHEIVILYDSSQNIPPSECVSQINGILSYYQTYHDLNAGNVLSFMTYNSSSINTITTFTDEYQKGVSFNDLTDRIKAATCNYIDYDTKSSNKGSNAYLAIKTVTNSIFNHQNRYYTNNKTPRIVLFTNYPSTTSSETDVCNYYNSYLSNHANLDISTTVVNFHTDDYLRCLSANHGGHSAKTYISFTSDINGINTNIEDKFAFYKNDIIYSICGYLNGANYCGYPGTSCNADTDCCGDAECDDYKCSGDWCKPGGYSCIYDAECCTSDCQLEIRGSRRLPDGEIIGFCASEESDNDNDADATGTGLAVQALQTVNAQADDQDVVSADGDADDDVDGDDDGATGDDDGDSDSDDDGDEDDEDDEDDDDNTDDGDDDDSDGESDSDSDDGPEDDVTNGDDGGDEDDGSNENGSAQALADSIKNGDKSGFMIGADDNGEGLVVSLSPMTIGNLWAAAICFILIKVALYWCYNRRQSAKSRSRGNQYEKTDEDDDEEEV